MNKFIMSKPTERKALKLVNQINTLLEVGAYFIAREKTYELNKMIERHIKKELK